MKRELLAEYRAARMIRERLNSNRPQVLCLEDVNQALSKCNRQRRRVAMALAKGWDHAAADSMRYLSTSLEELQKSIDLVTKAKNAQAYVCPPVSNSDVFCDLQSLRREFVEVRFNLELRTLTVHTDEITLEGISLGPFEIILHWGDKHGSPYYRVIATTPNPSATNSEVTHPHIQSESLCEGEGSTSIKRALKDGRLFDFFCIVDRILKTYNADSAYVEFDDWRGIECCDCGQRNDSSETQCCDRCDSDLCSSCHSA